MREYFQLHQRETLNILMTLAALLGALLLGLIAPNLGGGIFHRAERWLARAARSPWRSISMVSLYSLLICLLTFIIAGPPIPHVHDEFSYLLSGDTFAHGRLTNPPLPDDLVPFFETMHELMRPTYASKFGPAQGLFLALGRILTTKPYVGVWISTILGCGAITWALQGWLRARWALLGGLLTAIHPQIVYWSHIYWGGTVGMLGGALIFGAIARIMQRRKQIDAMILVSGFAIVANSRPYEAMLWIIAVGVTLLFWKVGWALPTIWLKRWAVPTLQGALVGIPIVAFMAYYNWRVTGDAMMLPYRLHTQQYMSVPLFFWEKPPPPKTYSNEQLRHHYSVYEPWVYNQQTSLGGWIWGLGAKFYKFWEQFLLRELILSAGFLALPFAIRGSWRAKLASIYLLIFAIGWAIIPWFEHHYPAPLMPVIMFLGIYGARWINAWRWRGVGRAFVRWCLVSCFIVLIPSLKREYNNTHGGWWLDRARILAKLESEPGKHLVIIHYGPDHISGNEWVFNAADIDSAKVVWARERSPSEMPTLLHHFPDRRIWRVHIENDDPPPPTLMPSP